MSRPLAIAQPPPLAARLFSCVGDGLRVAPRVLLGLVALAAACESPDGTGPDPDLADAADAVEVRDADRDTGLVDASDALHDTLLDTASDAQTDTAIDGNDADTTYTGPAIYPTDRTQSPLTPSVVERLRTIAAQGSGLQAGVFSKIGASASASVNFMHCFAGAEVDLGGRDELAATIGAFSTPVAGGTTPYDRESLCTVVGWSASSAIAGSPSPLQREVDAIAPRFAVVMYGTNDIQKRDIYGYADDMLDLTDALLRQGVVPLLTTIMPRDDDPAADLWVPHYNAVVRAIAQARQVPLIDFHRELLPLPDHGLGADDLHPSVYTPAAGRRPCDFTAEGLGHGYNVRNLITIEALDRMRKAVVEAGPAPDPAAPGTLGDGSTKAPFVIAGLPFSDVRDTTESPFRAIESYPGCAATQNEGGPEYVYRLELTEPRRIRASVYDRGEVDIDVHLLDETMLPAGCMARNHRTVVADLQPGTYHFVLDTFIASTGEKPGEYLFVVVEDNGAQ